MTDNPSPRKEHLEPTPLLGGAAIYLAVILALWLFGARQEVSQLAGIIIGATLVSFLGLWDDGRPLSPPVKLGGQLAATAVMVGSGVRVSLTGVTWVDIAITLAWMLAITNAMNFLDNMDGLSGGVGAVAAAAFLILAVANGQQLVAPLAAALLGACVGFLVYNFNPASVFMGDTGSLFLGFALAALGIKLRFPGQPVAGTWVIPVFVMAVPLVDLTLVIVSRVRRRVNPFTTGGSDHLSHRLVRRGMTRREAVLVHYLVGCAAAGLGLLASYTEPQVAFLLLSAAVVLAGWVIWQLDRAAQVSESTLAGGAT
jgi:UDP-GlcNAc:undecaprenyl-phosphate GlcNAc-1-phosphate transferase